MAEYLLALLGGVLIGISAGLYLLLNGRIMGVSGIAGGIFAKIPKSDKLERVFFIAGLIIAPQLYGLFADLPSFEISENTVLVMIAGLLVGFGSRLGSGCTSGHGVCGLGRFSKRSIVAVLVFMTTAIITVFVQNHVLG